MGHFWIKLWKFCQTIWKMILPISELRELLKDMVPEVIYTYITYITHRNQGWYTIEYKHKSFKVSKILYIWFFFCLLRTYMYKCCLVYTCALYLTTLYFTLVTNIIRFLRLPLTTITSTIYTVFLPVMLFDLYIKHLNCLNT